MRYLFQSMNHKAPYHMIMNIMNKDKLKNFKVHVVKNNSESFRESEMILNTNLPRNAIEIKRLNRKL